MANVYDEMVSDLDAKRVQTQKDIDNLSVEKQNVLNQYENNYNEQLTNYNDLMNQQQKNIDTWAETQKDTQQKQFEYEKSQIEKSRKETEKQTNAEIGNAYIDYQRSLNQFGGSAETLASQGLGGTGFAKNQDIAMNITYQNRVSTAKAALTKANTDFDDQLLRAQMNNDTTLAELALTQMQQSYALALDGFEYTSTLKNNYLNNIQSINDSYFSKQNTLQSRIDNYTSSINSAKAAKEQAAQSAADRAWEKEKYYSQLSQLGNYEDSSEDTSSDTTSKGTSWIKQLADKAKNDIYTSIASLNNKVTASYNPRLSGSKASTWFNSNLGTKTLTVSELKSLVDKAYNNGTITTSDRTNILNAYGVK